MLQKLKTITATKSGKVRLAVWCAVAVVCAMLSLLVLRAENFVYQEYAQTEVQSQDFTQYALQPGSSLTQVFTSQGKSSGYCWELFLNVLRADNAQGSLSLEITDLESQAVLTRIDADFSQITGCPDLDATLQEAQALAAMAPSQRPQWTEINPELTRHTVFNAAEEFYLYSGRQYALTVTNHSQTDALYLLGNDAVQSGNLLVNGEQQRGFVNLCFMRKGDYTPSKLVLVLTALTVVTVLAGLWLVLFTQVKEHVLYLLLAVGFGLVMLFDLTPLYGFDMAFQFDSTYIASNKLLGLEEPYYAHSYKNPDQAVVFYQRRACDDYSQFQFYYHNEVSANYTDLKAALRDPFVDAEAQTLIPVESDRGYVNKSAYLFLPQAVGFVIARLLGLGMLPMLQLARACMYAVFVAVMFYAIRTIPFGKRIFLIWALVPTVLVQTISLSYDAMILCMSYFVIAKATAMAYAESSPKILDWVVLLAVSALLAPCKWVYIPVSCSFFLVLYRQYILPAGDKWKPMALKVGIAVLVLLAAAVALKWSTLVSLYNEFFVMDRVSIYDSQSYTIPMMLSDPLWTVFVALNTIRNQLGSYLVNAVQLFDIRLGSSDGITLVVFALLALECCCVSRNGYHLKVGERIFLLLVPTGVFLLVLVASFCWTPSTSMVVEGLQGRYLTPVLPMVFLACHNNRLVRIEGSVDLLVKTACCIFPAITLMNMYLWTLGT